MLPKKNVTLLTYRGDKTDQSRLSGLYVVRKKRAGSDWFVKQKRINNHNPSCIEL